MPTDNELTQRRHARVILKLPQRVDREEVRRLQRDVDSGVIRIRGIATLDRLAKAFPIVEEAERAAVATALPAQPFVDHHRPAGGLVHGEMVGDEGRPRLLAILDLDRHRAFGATGLELSGTPAPVPGPPQARFEAFGKEREHVEHCRLAAAVGAEQHRQRRHGLELDILQRAEVLHSQILDPRGACAMRSRSAHSMYLMGSWPRVVGSVGDDRISITISRAASLA